MAKKKKKKKKRSPGGRKPSYAKGKPVELEQAAGKTGARSTVAAGPTADKGGGGAKSGGGGASQQWNVIRSGTIELKVFTALLVVIVLSALLQYPLFGSASEREYKKLEVKYEKSLKKWQDKYPTKEEQKKNNDKKPKAPVKPSTGALMLQILVGAVWTALMAFLALNISKRTDLGTPVLEKFYLSEGGGRDISDLLLYSVPAGLVSVAPLLAGAAIAHSYSGTGQWTWKDYPAWKYALYFINTGVQNTMLFVFLATAVFTWLFMKYRERLKLEPHWAGIACASLFALALNILPLIRGGSGASNGSMGAFALSPVIMVWVFGMGYLYWKKGLEYSLLAGVVGFGIYPILASLIFK